MLHNNHTIAALHKLYSPQCAPTATAKFNPLSKAVWTATPDMNQPTVDFDLPALDGGKPLEKALAENNRLSWMTAIDVVAHTMTGILNAKELTQTAFWNATENVSNEVMFECLCQLDMLSDLRANAVEQEQASEHYDVEIQALIKRLVATSASEKNKRMM